MKRLVLPTILVVAAGYLLMGTTGCASRSVLPDANEVKVSREAPKSSCREIGEIFGRTATAKGTEEQALADLKNEAAHKGANYVMIKQYSDYGTSVTGIAYECP